MNEHDRQWQPVDPWMVDPGPFDDHLGPGEVEDPLRRGDPMNRTRLQVLQRGIDHDKHAELRLLPLVIVAVAVIGVFMAVRWAYFV